MSTDITVGSFPEQIVDFDVFVRTDLPAIAQAVAVVADDQVIAAAALDRAVRSALTSWSSVGVGDESRRHIFATAVAHCIAQVGATDTDEPSQVQIRAAAVGHHWFDWSVAEIATTLDRSPQTVESYLDAADECFAQPGEPSPLRERVRTRVIEATTALPDVAQIKIDHQQAGQRRRRIKFGLVGAAALLALMVIAQFVSRPDRVPEVAAPAPEATTATTAAPEDRGQDNEAAPTPTPVGNESRNNGIPFPELIATDGTGGFVGVRSPSPANPEATFTWSNDGQQWNPATKWDFGPEARVTRFERSGTHYLLWVEDSSNDGVDLTGITVAVSSDLRVWRILDLALDDTEQPVGLIYQSNITELSVSGNSVLALVHTTVEIDFNALLLSEGYTCGHTIKPDEVTVNLCNGTPLDVLSLVGIDQLPERNQLFVSRDGAEFEQVPVPFGDQTAAHLTSVDDAFVITDEGGLRFAMSTDALTWDKFDVGKPPFHVVAAATNETEQVVGMGTLGTGQVVLFRSQGSSTSTTPLVELIPDVPSEIDALVASGPTRWVIYLYEPESRAWILTSSDAQTWEVSPSSPPQGGTPRLLVGDDEALVQWSDRRGNVTTLAVPLP